MKTTMRSLILAAALAALAIPAHAAQSVLCSPEIPSAGVNRVITNPVSTTSYSLNGQGCAVVKQADIGYLLSQGFSAGPPFGPNVLFTSGVATGTTAFLVGTLPPGTYLQHIIVQNTVAAAITGGINFGTTSGGADVVSALAVGSSALVFTTDAALLKRVFSATSPQPIYASAATAWNSANVTITLVYGYF